MIFFILKYWLNLPHDWPNVPQGNTQRAPQWGTLGHFHLVSYFCYYSKSILLFIVLLTLFVRWKIKVFYNIHFNVCYCKMCAWESIYQIMTQPAPPSPIGIDYIFWAH